MKPKALIYQNRRSASLWLACSVAVSCSTPAGRAGGTVTNATDADLRAAMSGGGLVTFSCDGTITLTNTLTNELTTVLDTTGHTIILQATNLCSSLGRYLPVFYVPTNSTLVLVGLTISNGTYTLSCGFPVAGSILNDGGRVNLVRVALRNNVAAGPDDFGGGGLRNLGGEVSATNCFFTGNVALGLKSGHGGAVANLGGRFTAWNCTFDSNSAQGLRDPGYLCCISGPPGLGGAIYSTGTLEMGGCTIVSNSASGSSGLAGSGTSGSGCDGMPGGSGGSGYGSALYSSGVAHLVNCTITANASAGGRGANGANGASCQFGGNGGNGGNGGSGLGAIYASSVLTMTNCTFALNSASTSTGGQGGAGGYGTAPPPHGANGSPGQPGSPGSAVAGLIATNATLVNCILASNAPAGDTIGTDLGHNLSSGSTFTDSSSLNNTDPRLGPLSQNGGPALTMALLPGSPAIDAGDTASAPTTDQRGVARPRQGPVDIGAFQYSFDVPELYVSRFDPSGFQLLGAGKPTHTCRLLGSADLSNWIPIVTNQFGADGTVLLQDNWSSNSPQEFYRLVTQ